MSLSLSVPLLHPFPITFMGDLRTCRLLCDGEVVPLSGGLCLDPLQA